MQKKSGLFGTDPRDAYVPCSGKWAKQVGPMAIVGPEYHVEKEWGHHWPIGQHKVTKEPSLVKRLNCQSFLHVGLIFF